jgi:hypothetical protein
MFKKQILLTLTSVFCLFSMTNMNGQDKTQVPLKEKTIKGKTVKTIDASKLEDGTYAFALSSVDSVDFQVVSKKIVDQKSTTQSSGYTCKGLICHCPLSNSADCETMISKEKCDQLLEIGGTLYGIKKQGVSSGSSGFIGRPFSFKVSATVTKRAATVPTQVR